MLISGSNKILSLNDSQANTTPINAISPKIQSFNSNKNNTKLITMIMSRGNKNPKHASIVSPIQRSKKEILNSKKDFQSDYQPLNL